MLNAVQCISVVFAEEMRCYGECWLSSVRMAGMSSQCPENLKSCEDLSGISVLMSKTTSESSIMAI